MSKQHDRHAPTAEFRTRLEREVLDAIRVEGAASGARPAVRSRPWLRTAALILVSIGLGAAGGAGSAQVRDNQQRARLLEVEAAELALEARRVEIASANLEQIRRRFEAGILSREAVAEAEAELRALEASLARTRLDIEEIRATSIPVRDDLTAPRVDGRDFVLERLRLDLVAAQQRLAAAERALEEATRRVSLGAAPGQALQEPRANHARAREEFERLAAQAELREAFLRERLSAQEVARRAQLRQLEVRLETLATLQTIGKQRLEEMREREQVGMIDEVELLRAQLEVAQAAAEMRRIEAELRALTPR